MEETIWNGGFYELTVEFSAVIKLQDVVQTLKKHLIFQGFGEIVQRIMRSQSYLVQTNFTDTCPLMIRSFRV